MSRCQLPKPPDPRTAPVHRVSGQEHGNSNGGQAALTKRPGSLLRCLGVFAALASISGCDVPIERFDPNLVYAVALERSRDVPTESAARDVELVVTELFGTPENPRWPSEWLTTSQANVISDEENLRRAVGMVRSDEDDRHEGLYREHCVQCHGIEGGGNGPASLFQNPYPRDFRAGVFKWKSTKRASKPTRQDWLRLLRRGIPGTSMPSFALLSKSDLNVLIDYTIYLAIRGETERQLMAIAIDELGYEEEAPDDEWNLAKSISEGGSFSGEAGQVVIETLREVVQPWALAEEEIVEVPESRSDGGEPVAISLGSPRDVESIERGRAIYTGQIANCVGCHGADGNGDVVTLDYDDWTKEYTTRIGITPSDREAMRPLRNLGALPPRPIRPRRLSDGIFHGPGTPSALYRHITQGIAGSPMPSLAVTDQESPMGLTSDQVWDLVSYVLSLNSGAQSSAKQTTDAQSQVEALSQEQAYVREPGIGSIGPLAMGINDDAR